MHLGVVILAAGRSGRMGRPKLLLPWGDTSILGHLVLQWRNLGAGQLAVVRAEGAGAMEAELERLRIPARDRIINPHPERGMFGSVRLASAWTGWRAGLTHWAITLGDQPQVKAETLQGLLAFAAAHPGGVCQPRYGGHGRHPVILPEPAFRALAASRARTLREFLRREAGPVAGWSGDDPGLAVDLDTPADYARFIP
jgi:molybdenum cofactor cytidylyltransferase